MACSAFDKHSQYKDVAQSIKKDYDKRYPSSGKANDGVYHAVVGKHFGGESVSRGGAAAHRIVRVHIV